ncbi:MAG: hypothetical protein IPJ19_15345 [Planctomycetes bacterium]|nr:hypothetical protein [Planctomycetota bacterium]
MTNTEELTLLRHTVSTLAYRASKVLRDFPDTAAAQRIAPDSRTPLEIVSHLGDLMRWAESLAHGESRWDPRPASEWSVACEDFFTGLAALDSALAAADPRARAPGQIFQGPIADALTHVGQLALLRGAAGSAVRPESYARAGIQIGRVGREQPPPSAEFDGDASRRAPKAG